MKVPARSALARLAVTVLALGLIGCSDDDEPAADPDDTTTTTVLVTTTEAPESTTTTIDPEKQAFLAAGDAICGEMNDRVEGLMAPFGEAGPSTPEDAAGAITATVVFIDQAIAELRELPAPPGDEAELEEMYAEVDALLDLS